MRSAIQCEDDINKGKEEEPDNINKMPVPSCRFKPEMLLGFKPALHQARPTDKEEDRSD